MTETSRTVPIREFQDFLPELVDEITNTRNRIMVSDGRSVVAVLISLEEYQELLLGAGGESE